MLAVRLHCKINPPKNGPSPATYFPIWGIAYDSSSVELKLIKKILFPPIPEYPRK